MFATVKEGVAEAPLGYFSSFVWSTGVAETSTYSDLFFVSYYNEVMRIRTSFLTWQLVVAYFHFYVLVSHVA